MHILIFIIGGTWGRCVFLNDYHCIVVHHLLLSSRKIVWMAQSRMMEANFLLLRYTGRLVLVRMYFLRIVVHQHVIIILCWDLLSNHHGVYLLCAIFLYRFFCLIRIGLTLHGKSTHIR